MNALTHGERSAEAAAMRAKVSKCLRLLRSDSDRLFRSIKDARRHLD